MFATVPASRDFISHSGLEISHSLGAVFICFSRHFPLRFTSSVWQKGTSAKKAQWQLAENEVSRYTHALSDTKYPPHHAEARFPFSKEQGIEEALH